ncbi:MAG: UDP-N-acetylmuramoyl-L-alanine--D-glutamate ligase [Patescibacteria group bacterium]
MKQYKKYFKDKKITVMGLGLLGRGIGYTKFLAECGAVLTVTDLKTKEQLAPALKVLGKFRNITYVLGQHRLKDFQKTDMIIKAAGVPLDSPFIAEARKNRIPVEMDASLFARLSPDVTIVGITGTRGKTMTTMLAYEILKANEKFLKKNVYLGGNIRGMATLPLLSKVKGGDIVILELDSWQLQGFGEAKISPAIAVFTTFLPDHMNYYKDMKKYFADKANIFKYQSKDDTLIVRPDMKKLIPKNIKSALIIAKAKDVEKYDFIVPGKHQKENLACAVQVAKIFAIPDPKIKKAVKDFKGVEGRLQYVKTVDGVKIYNDNNATTPEATMAGIEALSIEQGTKKFVKKIILIAGGADKGVDTGQLVKVIDRYCKDVILLDGTGTQKMITHYKLRTPYAIVASLKEAAKIASGVSKKGDIVLFSPAFASFGMFTNEYHRNDEFMKIVKKLK